MRDVDWVVAYGPSFLRTNRVIGLMGYNLADKVVDDAVTALAARVQDHEHGPWDAGVPGVRATIGFGDNAPRVYARPRSKLLVITAPEDATRAIDFFKKSPPNPPPPNEAFRLTVREPHRHLVVAGVPMSDKLEQLRFWIVPTAAGGAELNVEGDTSTEVAAQEIADSWNDVVARSGALVRAATSGLTGNIRFVSEKKQVRMHVDSSPEQTEAVARLLSAATGVPLASKDAGP
jgi:hypothetical protein